MYDINLHDKKVTQIIYHLNSQLPQKTTSSRITDEQIRQALTYPLSNLVGETRRGGINKVMAICPFHKDTKPSLSISTDKNLYYCFVCNQGGTPITYVQKTQNLSFREAVMKLCN
jgi:DNA primase